jgi:hypothetical protein
VSIYIYIYFQLTKAKTWRENSAEYEKCFHGFAHPIKTI